MFYQVKIALLTLIFSYAKKSNRSICCTLLQMPFVRQKAKKEEFTFFRARIISKVHCNVLSRLKNIYFPFFDSKIMMKEALVPQKEVLVAGERGACRSLGLTFNLVMSNPFSVFCKGDANSGCFIYMHTPELRKA